MSDIYEAVRMSIKSKIPAEQEVDGRIVKTNREDILQSVPFHVKMAVTKLQEKEVIPPRSYTFQPEADRRSYTNSGGEEIYRYFKLPDNFSSLKSIQVDGVDVDWKYYDNEHMIDRMALLRNEALYKVMKLNMTNDSDYQDVLILAPWPERQVFIKYYVSGSKDTIHLIDETYWSAIISRVESRLGLTSKREADEEASDVATKWANPQQRGEVVKRRPSFFGMGIGRNSKRVI